MKKRISEWEWECVRVAEQSSIAQGFTGAMGTAKRSGVISCPVASEPV
ncbi:MAG: hypothetical protein F6K24_12985 [Okeania sp. SIO2D1]|nr:hypothetical protein [Okeania sp. SIO2D1]